MPTYLLLALLLSSSLAPLLAQNADLQLWQTLDLRQELLNDWSLDFSNQIRLKNGELQANLLQFQGSKTLKIKQIETPPSDSSKKAKPHTLLSLQPSLGLRLKIQNGHDELRYYLDQNLSFRPLHLPLRLDARLRFQHENSPAASLQDPQGDLRLRLRLLYSIHKQWNLILPETEVFYKLYGASPSFYRFRLGLGLQWKQDKNNEWSIDYRWQTKLQEQGHSHLLQLRLRHAFKPLKRKKNHENSPAS